jgi:hypothetical protein
MMIPMMPMVLITLMMPLMLMMLAMAPMLARGHRRCLRAGVAADGGGEPGGAEELPAACVLELLAMVAEPSGDVAWVPSGRQRRGCLGAKQREGAWGPAAEDATCGSVRSSGPKMRALARRINGAGRAGTHASASRTGKSGRGARSGAKESGGAFGAAAGAGVLVPSEERARRRELLKGG